MTPWTETAAINCPSTSAAQQFPFLFELRLVDLAPCETSLKDIEGTPLASVTAVRASTMAIPVMMTAVNGPTDQPEDQRHETDDGQEQDERSEDDAGMPAPAARHVAIAVHPARAICVLLSESRQRQEKNHT